MPRSKRIILTSHCILNQNTVIDGEARALGAIPSAVHWIVERGYGILQLPCPEFTFLGLDRPPMTYEEYDTKEYRAHCRHILEPIISQVKEYLGNGYIIEGILGIQSSPSCDQTRGVFMEEVHQLFFENGIEIKTLWYLPNNENPVFDGDAHKL
ncbi:CD3072 family TudS-related putative desulfidase [Bacillus sp. FJAT-27445]|uniref:CD3072 family TudS-related putative desulfidase n=1 Tax=Bacillus sp. FJAT-27445 TaxID=1679166 RepID=UPI0007442E33|nr:CD3072 family TudS-related putative desulfidase [Bacillus sp. FJAT-27445]